MTQLSSIEDSIAAIRDGRMIILLDDEDRENEGDIVVAADAVTPEQIAFMAREARGLICLALAPDLADRLALMPMAEQNNTPLGTAFTHSIDHVSVAGPTSVSASARAATMRAAVAQDARADDFVAPGHVFPLRARSGGVLVRSGQTEGSVDLARLAGRAPAGVICEIMGPDGTMMRLPQLVAFAERFDMPITSVAALIRYRLEHERLVKVVAEARLPTEHGDFEVRCYENTIDGRVHVALIHGEIRPDVPTLVRVHRADVVADVFGLGVHRARNQLGRALARIAQEPSGVIVYLRPDGDADPVDERVRFYGALTRGEKRPAAATMGFHDFGVGAQILSDLGLGRIRVMTSSPRVFKGLSGHGLEIIEWVGVEPDADAP
jgi:3,4-dihydroxy 2-butanone 4-phosphate synthase/GTP cyclohydrolase II